MKWKTIEPEILKSAAVIVAAPRYMGAFAAAIGISLIDHWPWMATVEIGSGAAMALLEGWAIAFVFRRWRIMKVNSKQWKILLYLQLALLLALPLVAAPYLLSAQYGQPINQIAPWPVVALWSLLVAAIAPLVLAAVGYSDAEPIKSQPKASTKSAQEQKEPAPSPLNLAPLGYTCQECGRSFGSQPALNAHSPHCKKVPMPTNGNHRPG